MRYVIVGDTSADLILELDAAALGELCHMVGRDLALKAGQKVPAQAGATFAGGNGANVAVALTRLAAKASFSTHLGRDGTGELLRSLLEEEGIKLGSQPTVASSSYSAVLLYCGERTIVSYHTPGPYQLPTIKDDDELVLCSLGEGSEEVIAQLLSYERPLVFLPGTRQLRAGLKECQPLLKRSRLLVLNQEEATQLLGTSRLEPSLLAERLLDQGVEEVVITAGPHGAVAARTGESWQIGIWAGLPKVDPTGAGDSFAATYLWARDQQLGLPEALRLATVQAGSVVAQLGAQPGLLKKQKLLAMAKKVELTARRANV